MLQMQGVGFGMAYAVDITVRDVARHFHAFELPLRFVNSYMAAQHANNVGVR